MKTYQIPILIFIASLLLITSLSIGALLVNDSWITVNQLHQIDQGQQLIFSEGKFGAYENGTPYQYMEYRHNVLHYTLFLPVISYPVLSLISIFGDFFGYFIFALWTLALLIFALLIQELYPQYSMIHYKNWQIRWTSLLIIGSILIFIINLFLYVPAIYTPGTAPFEVAAVILTNHILFAFTMVVIYFIFNEIFEQTTLSLIGTCISLCCSSYLIWGGTAKDHILVAFIIALIVFAFIRGIKHNNYYFFAAGFLCIGLLTWARPEIALFVFIISSIWIVTRGLSQRLKNHNVGFTQFLAPPLFTIIGAVPFFINNVLISGHPLIPPWYAYDLFENSISTAAGEVSTSLDTMQQSIFQKALQIVFDHITPHFSTLTEDLYGVLFYPQSGNMGLIGVTPILFLGMIVLTYTFLRKKTCFTTFEKEIMVFLTLLSLGLFLSYSGKLLMHADAGIAPDMRYFSTMYIPGAILGIITLKTLFQNSNFQKKMLKNLMIWFFPLAIGLLVTVNVLRVSAESAAFDNAFFTTITIFFLIINIFLILLYFEKKISIKHLAIPFSIMILVPLIWQFDIVLYYACRRFDGYEFWLPVMSSLYDFYYPFVQYALPV